MTEHHLRRELIVEIQHGRELWADLERSHDRFSRMSAVASLSVAVNFALLLALAWVAGAR